MISEVKYTFLIHQINLTAIEEAIQNGVKKTNATKFAAFEDAIENGVKHTEYGDWLDGDERFDDIIENGVKDTRGSVNRGKNYDI